MTVRCKFKCDSKTETVDGFRVHFSPVIGSSNENKEFFKWTPSGSLEFGTINQVAADVFIPGAEYYLDLIPV